MEQLCSFEYQGKPWRLLACDGRFYVGALEEVTLMRPADADLEAGMKAVALSYLRGNGCMMVEEAARELVQMVRGFNWGRKRLFRWLRENGFCSVRRDTYNQPTHHAVSNGWMKLAWKQSATNTKQGFSRYFVPVVTQKGLAYFAGRLANELSRSRRSVMGELF